MQTKSWILVSDFIYLQKPKSLFKTTSYYSIPGFQVYDVTTGKIKRYGKEYGKKLNESTVKDGKDFLSNNLS